MLFTAVIRNCGGHANLFEGSYDACMALVHAVEVFEQDYTSVEVYESDILDTKYKKVSPFWA